MSILFSLWTSYFSIGYFFPKDLQISVMNFIGKTGMLWWDYTVSMIIVTGLYSFTPLTGYIAILGCAISDPA